MTIPTVSKTFVKRTIDSVRDTIGRDIDVYTQNLGACTICIASGYLDPVSNASFYFTCPECSGSYWINTATKTTILARVHWVGNEGGNATPGGKYFVGEAQVTVDPEYHSLFQGAQRETGKVVVDGQDMQIIQIRPMGAPEINRYRIVLKGMGNRPQ